jgi:hypothetical protein
LLCRIITFIISSLSHKEAARTLEGLESEHLKKLHVDQDQADDPLRDISNAIEGSYRSIDGKGNNVRNPNYGRAKTGFTRVLPSSYADGISKPRRAMSGKALPNARKVSSVVFKDRNRNSRKLSHMSMIWGQIIDHDINHGAQPDIDCSATCGLSGECFGIRVPQDDKPFRSKGKTCIQLKRDVPVLNPSSILRPREQINIKSSFIDASQIYGDDPQRFRELRLSGTGFLREMKNPAGKSFKNLLPKRNGGFCRTTDEATMPCFKSGDIRTNENPGTITNLNKVTADKTFIVRLKWSRKGVPFVKCRTKYAKRQHRELAQENVFIKIPRTLIERAL